MESMISKNDIEAINSLLQIGGSLSHKSALAILHGKNLLSNDAIEILKSNRKHELINESFIKKVLSEQILNRVDKATNNSIEDQKINNRISELLTFMSEKCVSEDKHTIIEEAHNLDREERSKESFGSSSPESPTCLVVGAGVSGIAACYYLLNKGTIPSLIEKNDKPGGSWYMSSYPGARVDVANMLYAYSFAFRNLDKDIYSKGEDVLKYLIKIVAELSNRVSIRYNTALKSATQLNDKSWKIELSERGNTKIELFDNLIIARGQLSQPFIPTGINPNRRSVIHSGNWNNYSKFPKIVKKKGTAIIGNAASALQLSLELSDSEKVTVYYRSHNWFYNIPHYKARISDALANVLKSSHLASKTFRLSAFSDSIHGRLDEVSTDSRGVPTALAQAFHTKMRGSMAELGLEQFIPNYTPGERRILLDDGSWGEALKTKKILYAKFGKIVPSRNAVISHQGDLVEYDRIILCTGFNASNFLGGFTVTNSTGKTLSQSWFERPIAYAGIVIPEFENLYFMYGPNTNGVVNGSALYFIESQAKAISSSVANREKKQTAGLYLEALSNLFQYQKIVDNGNLHRAWSHGSSTSWYRHQSGYNIQNWPFSLTAYSAILNSFAKFINLKEIYAYRD